MWVLGLGPRTFARVASVLDRQAISPAPSGSNFVFETGFFWVARADLELTQPTPTTPDTGIKGEGHHCRAPFCFTADFTHFVTDLWNQMVECSPPSVAGQTW